MSEHDLAPSPDPLSPGPLSPWTARGVGAVCFAALGVWFFVGGLERLAQLTELDADLAARAQVRTWTLAAVAFAMGIGLFLGARRLATRLHPDDHATAAPSLDAGLAGALGLLGAGLTLAHLHSLLVIACSYALYDATESPRPPRLVADAIGAGLGVVLFARAHAIARVWSRWNGPR